MSDEKVVADSTPSLDSIFSGGAEQSPAPSTAAEKETPIVEEKPAATPEEKSSSPSKASDESEKVAEPSEDEKAAKAAEEKVATDKVAAEKAEADKAKPKEPVVTDEQKKDQEAFKKRFEDTAKWAQDVNQQNTQLRQIAQQQARQLEVLQKKVDGTWTDDDEASENAPYKPEAVAAHGVLIGKIAASRESAVREHGEAKVTTTLNEFHQLFNDNDAVQMAVRNSNSPIHEALSIMERYHFQEKFGVTPGEWEKNITAAAEKNLRATLRKEILEEIRVGKGKKADTPTTLSNMGGEKGGDESKEERMPSLDDIFSHK